MRHRSGRWPGRWADENGWVERVNRLWYSGRIGPIFRLILALLGIVLLWGAIWIYYRAGYPDTYREHVIRYAGENQLPPALVYGVIHTESRMRPSAVSHAGARGLMQITEDAYEWAKMRMGGDDTHYDDLFDPATNIRYGSYILRLLLDRFGDLATALCAYHAGAGNVESWLKRPEYSSDGCKVDKIPYRDTHWYVDRVLRAEKIYGRLYARQGGFTNG